MSRFWSIILAFKSKSKTNDGQPNLFEGLVGFTSWVGQWKTLTIANEFEKYFSRLMFLLTNASNMCTTIRINVNFAIIGTCPFFKTHHSLLSIVNVILKTALRSKIKRKTHISDFFEAQTASFSK